METGIPGERDKDFTTVGKPKVTVIVTIVKVVYIRLHFYIKAGKTIKLYFFVFLGDYKSI